MNMDCFLKRYVQVLMNDENDHVFSEIKLLTSGTTSPRIAKLLNFATSQMNGNECYLEVGVFTGATLCSASYVNERVCIGIDNYDPAMIKDMTKMSPSDIRDRCLLSIRSVAPTAQLIEKDFRNVSKEEIGHPVAVSFIDGKHTYDDVKENLAWLEPMLADDAIVVFDDVNFEGVQTSISDFLKLKSANYDLLFYAKPFFCNDSYVWSVSDRFLNNGVCILRYHRDPSITLMMFDPRNKI